MSTVLLASKKTRPEAAAVQNEAEMRIKSWRLSPLPKEVDSSCNYRSRCILSNILGIFNLLATYRVVKQDFKGVKNAVLNQKSMLNLVFKRTWVFRCSAEQNSSAKKPNSSAELFCRTFAPLKRLKSPAC